MNFSQLKYIVSVDQHRNFARAAKQCHVTQPTLSKEIQKLERSLEVMIFDRTRVPVVPTDKGRQLIDQARRVLREIEHFNSIASQAQDLAGECWLGVCPSIAPYLLPLFLPKFSLAHPSLKIHIKEMESSALVEALHQDQLDAILVSHAGLDSSLYQLTIGRESFVAYLSDQHPLFNETHISAQALPSQSFYLPREIAENIKHDPDLQALYQQFDLASNVILDSGSLETLRRFVEMGKGITLIPELAALYMGARRLRFIRPVIDPVPTRQLVLTSRRGFRKYDLLVELKKTIADAFEQGVADLVAQGERSDETLEACSTGSQHASQQ